VTEAEANLVDVLREQAMPIVSLVAEEGQKIVGHILFSPVALSGHPGEKIMGLAPMAVLPEFQRCGVGTQLVKAGLKSCAMLGCAAIVVLGHPEFYPRFGFLPAVKYGVECDYDVPPEVFMALELQSAALAGKAGKVEYHSAFASI